jgi:hypothetical protein
MKTAYWILLFMASTLAAQEIAVRGSDGGWYFGDTASATIEKRAVDGVTFLWRSQGGAGQIRSLKAAPGGGVAMLTAGPFRSATISTWNDRGDRIFTGNFLMNVPRMTVDRRGDLLIVGDSLRVMRLSAQGELLGNHVVDVPAISSLAGVEVAADGAVFVAGGTESTTLPVTPNAWLKAKTGPPCVTGGRFVYTCSSGWIGRFDPDTLAVTSLTYVAGAEANVLTGLTLDAAGQPMVVGTAYPRTVAQEPYPRTEGTVRSTVASGTNQLMTISRLSPQLDRMISSTWLSGVDGATGLAVELDEEGRVLLRGQTASPNFPATEGWATVCGPRRGTQSSYLWDFALRLSPGMDRVEGVGHYGRTRALAFVDWDSRVACVFNGGSYVMSREVATGQIVTLIGGPFTEEDVVTLDGAEAPILYRSSTQINLVLPRSAGVGTDKVLRLSGREVRRLMVEAARPEWIWDVRPDGTLANRGNFQINARRRDGSLNSDENGFEPGEEVRAYATGIDLRLPLQVFAGFYDVPVTGVQAEYVPGTFEGVVEIRFPAQGLGLGVAVLGLRNGEAFAGSNPGFVWLVP